MSGCRRALGGKTGIRGDAAAVTAAGSAAMAVFLWFPYRVLLISEAAVAALGAGSLAAVIRRGRAWHQHDVMIRKLWTVLRPGSWSRPAGGSPARVDTGVPGSRPRFVVERRRAERGVKSLFGGSKHAGRSLKRTLQPRQIYNAGAEPLMSRRRPCLAGPVPGSARRVLPGYGGRHACMVWAGTGETRLPGLCRAKTAGISRW
jgi:hypothetical protein